MYFKQYHFFFISLMKQPRAARGNGNHVCNILLSPSKSALLQQSIYYYFTTVVLFLPLMWNNCSIFVHLLIFSVLRNYI